MSKFDAVFKKIEEQMPTMTQNTGAAKPPVTNQNQQSQYDQKIIDELVAAQTKEQVEMALQKLEAMKAQQQKPTGSTTTTTQPAV